MQFILWLALLLRFAISYLKPNYNWPRGFNFREISGFGFLAASLSEEWPSLLCLSPQNEKRKTRKPDMRVVKIISEGIFIKNILRNSDDNDDDAKDDRNCDVDNPVHRRRCESRSVNRIHGWTTCSASLARPGHCRSCQKTSTSTSL